MRASAVRSASGPVLWKALTLAALGAAVLLATTARTASAEEAGDVQRRLQALESRIAELESQLAALGGRAAPGGAAEAAELRRRLDLLAAELEKLRIGQAAAGKPLESRYGLGPAASRVYGASRGVSIGGYGEALFEDFDARDDGGMPSGRTDRFDFLRGVLYFGYKFSDRIVFNSEVEYEHASTGEGGEVSLEFAYLDFLTHPKANVRAGMLLVPAGFINELHEPPIFLGARRPDVERRILPSTWRENGAGIFGDLGAFSYRAYVLAGLSSDGFSASNGVRGGRQSGAESKAEDLALATRLDFTGVPGLLVGGFYYQGDSAQGDRAPLGFTVDPNGAPLTPPSEPFDATVRIYDLHAEYRARGLDLRALYAGGRIDDVKQINDAGALDGAASVGERLKGWYAQAGWDVFSLRQRTDQALVPYVRYEAFDTQDRVPGETPRDLNQDPNVAPAPFAADPANDVRIWTYGVAYKPIFNVSLKLDYQDFKNEAGSAVDQFSFAISYLF